MSSLPYKKLDLASEFGSLGLRDVVAPDIFFYTTPNLSHVSSSKRNLYHMTSYTLAMSTFDQIALVQISS